MGSARAHIGYAKAGVLVENPGFIAKHFIRADLVVPFGTDVCFLLPTLKSVDNTLPAVMTVLPNLQIGVRRAHHGEQRDASEKGNFGDRNRNHGSEIGVG